MTSSIEDEQAILLIGAGGQLGGEFVKQFRHYRVPLVMTSSRADFQVTFQVDAEAKVHSGVDRYPRWRHVDVRSRDSLVRLIDDVQPRVLVNTSAYTDVDGAEKEQASAHAINIVAPKDMAQACASRGVVLVHFSTDYVFNGQSSRGYTEQDEARPLNAYGLSKLLGERAVLEADAGHFVFRTSWLYTPGGRNFVTTMLRLFRGESSVRVVDDQVGCPTWARDLAAVLTSWLMHTPTTRLKEQAGLYHLCSAGECSWYEFAGAIRERMNPKAVAELVAIDSAAFAAAATRPEHSVLDCSLARDALKLELPDWHDALDAAMPEFNAAARAGH